MSDWLLDNLGWVLLIVGGGLLVIMFLGTSACIDERKQLIEACTKDKAEYECKAMFSGYCSGGSSTVVPVPVVIPSSGRSM